jgi:WD40 repeat protein
MKVFAIVFLLVLVGCQRSPPVPVLRWRGEDIGYVTTVAFSPDGKTIASTNMGPPIRLWDTDSGKKLSIFNNQEDGMSFSLSFSPNGKIIVSADSYNVLNEHESGDFLDLFDVEGKKQASLKQSESISAVAFSPDGNIIASGSRDGTIRFFIAKNLKNTATIHTNSVNRIVFSPDGKILASAEYAESSFKNDPENQTIKKMANVRLIDVIHGTEIANLNLTRWVSSVAFSPDGKTLASAGWEEAVTLWDVETHTKKATINAHFSPVYSVAFSPDGKILAFAGGEGVIEIWDLATGKSTIAPEEVGMCLCVTFSPNGKCLAGAGGKTGAVFLWDLR